MNSVYIHIPFCTNICSYCDFSKIYYHKKYIKPYLDSLKEEILKNYKGEIINTIYIGGGTPSCLSECELLYLMEIVKIFTFSADFEFTFECNIENTTLEKLNILFNNGVNRLSFGVQTFNNNHLQFLNRKHNKEDIIKTINEAKKVGFVNINIDLIYGIPNQNLSDLESDLEDFISLNIPHISAYSLIIEKNTVLAVNGDENISEDLEYEMYQTIRNTLNSHGYIQYEISNYSKDSYASKHNLNYWNNGYYYGFGLSSVGFISNNVYTYNTKNMKKYLCGKKLEKTESIDIITKMSNEMILGLRKIKGVNTSKFLQKYGKNIEDVYQLSNLIEEKKLIIENGYIKINPDYIYLSNDILINFID